MTSPPADRPSVFLGVPSVLTARQAAHLEDWLLWLAARSVNVLRLQRENYSDNPWSIVCQTIAQASGILLLGFEQLDSRGSLWRPNTHEEEAVEVGWSSPWLQLEAGIAVAFGIPVLAACEHGIREGAFDSRSWVAPVYGTSIANPDIRRNAWLSHVRENWSSGVGSAGISGLAADPQH
jgi:hypothetical protein